MKFKLTQVNKQDVSVKALKVFISAFLGVFVAGVTDLLSSFQNGGLNALKSAGLAVLTGAIAAGINAIWNTYLQAKV